MFKYFSGSKIYFLDEILIALNSKPIKFDEDELSLLVCNSATPFQFKEFLPKDNERLFLRSAMLYLEDKNLIHKFPNTTNIEIPIYLISYEGIILVKKGGLGKQIILERLKDFLQRLAFLTAFITLLFNIIIQYPKIKDASFGDSCSKNIPLVKPQLKKVK